MPGPDRGGLANSCVTFVIIPLIGSSLPAFDANLCDKAAPFELPIRYIFPLAPRVRNSAIIAAIKAGSSGSEVHV